jgi:hypothetical protein
MDGFEVIAIVVGFASITSWFGIRNASGAAHLRQLPFEVIAMAVSWIAALVISYLMLGGLR